MDLSVITARYEEERRGGPPLNPGFCRSCRSTTPFASLVRRLSVLVEHHGLAFRIHSCLITGAGYGSRRATAKAVDTVTPRSWPLLMILADIGVATRMLLNWCGRSICTSQQRWLAGAQRLPASLKDSPTYSEMPLQGRDLVPPVRFVENFVVAPSADSGEIFPADPCMIQWLQMFMDQWLWNLLPAATVCSTN